MIINKLFKPTRYARQQRKHWGNIQGDTRLMNYTVGDDFLSLCDQNVSYKHVPDFVRLRRYCRLKLRIGG